MFSLALKFENDKKVEAAQRKARIKEFEKARKTMSIDQRNASQTRQANGGQGLKSSASEGNLAQKMQNDKQQKPQKPLSSQVSITLKQDQTTELKKPTQNGDANES